MFGEINNRWQPATIERSSCGTGEHEPSNWMWISGNKGEEQASRRSIPEMTKIPLNT